MKIAVAFLAALSFVSARAAFAATCPAPKVDNGFVGVSATGEASIKCEDGYKLSSSVKPKCGPQGWSTSFPECLPVSCPRLAAPKNGYIDTNPAHRCQFGQCVVYACDEGAVPSGALTLTCEHDRWSGPVPTCTQSKCTTPPPSLTNGSFQPAQGPFTGEVKYSCKAGYKLFGPATTVCQAGEKNVKSPWSATEKTVCYLQPFKLFDVAAEAGEPALLELSPIYPDGSCPGQTMTVADASIGGLNGSGSSAYLEVETHKPGRTQVRVRCHGLDIQDVNVTVRVGKVTKPFPATIKKLDNGTSSFVTASCSHGGIGASTSNPHVFFIRNPHYSGDTTSATWEMETQQTGTATISYTCYGAPAGTSTVTVN